jgi:hypothetical protein
MLKAAETEMFLGRMLWIVELLAEFYTHSALLMAHFKSSCRVFMLLDAPFIISEVSGRGGSGRSNQYRAKRTKLPIERNTIR